MSPRPAHPQQSEFEALVVFQQPPHPTCSANAIGWALLPSQAIEEPRTRVANYRVARHRRVQRGVLRLTWMIPGRP